MPPDLVQGRSRPEWVGDDGGTSPYDSSWYVFLPPRIPRKKVYAALERHESSKVDWVLAETLKAARWKVKKLLGRQGAPPGAGRRDEPEGGAPRQGPKPRGKKRKRSDAEATPAAAPVVPGRRQKHAKWGNTVAFE
ncbi:unnamed protein product [Prorocentrum cordatum]|uniref:Uncharacterized protein n=1 Tax=Prorocentrum cordatum TaxID=2364126 RepID=A0ABN9V287_9DINO|nr:unnamed protein product [Polarella glacialis]